ncbi:MAG TPA: hypothetical protein VGE74_13155 [Gemmata sp.]
MPTAELAIFAGTGLLLVALVLFAVFVWRVWCVWCDCWRRNRRIDDVMAEVYEQQPAGRRRRRSRG